MTATVVRPVGTMLPEATDTPDVLPTDRLGPDRPPHRRASATRCTGSRTSPTWATSSACGSSRWACIWLANWWGNPIGWIAVFFLMGRAFARFAILGHEAAHRLLFSNRKVNDWVGTWVLAYPGFVPLDGYRREPHGPPQGGVRSERTRHGRSTRATRSRRTPGGGRCDATRSATRAGRTSRAC